MKTFTKLTAAAVLAIAAAAPAFAKDSKPVHRGHAMSQIQKNEATRAQASVPVTQPVYDRGPNPADY